MKTYGEYCSIAKSLDVVGDRWTLLIVRELILRGACRYTDLRNGLPGIASNLLADRLRDLEAAGLVAKEEAPPPIATTLFRLTSRGEELRPVLEELMRWGMPLMSEEGPADAVRSHWIAGALELGLSDRHPEDAPVSLELQTGHEPIVLKPHDGTIDIELGSAEHPDAILSGPPKAILGLLLGFVDLPEAEATGVTYQGDHGILARVVAQKAPSAAPS
jgi:DNA-binding HxlR family transcriptional regulator